MAAMITILILFAALAGVFALVHRRRGVRSGRSAVLGDFSSTSHGGHTGGGGHHC